MAQNNKTQSTATQTAESNDAQKNTGTSNDEAKAKRRRGSSIAMQLRKAAMHFVTTFKDAATATLDGEALNAFTALQTAAAAMPSTSLSLDTKLKTAQAKVHAILTGDDAASDESMEALQGLFVEIKGLKARMSRADKTTESN